MNEPIETGGFRHWLRFEGIGFNDMYQIAEPPGFDAISRNIDQGKLFARDVRHAGLDKLTFIRNARLDNNGIEQTVHPNGSRSTYLDYGLDWIFHGLKLKGFEFKAYYILEEDGVFAPEQTLDFGEDKLTDGRNYLTCKLIDKNDVMIIKRRIDDIYNALSDKDYKQNTIAPVPTFKCLLKSTPVLKESSWTKSINIPSTFQITKAYFICFNRNLNLFGISNTLTAVDDVLFDTFGTQRSMSFAQHVAGGSSYLNVPDGTYMKLLKAKRLINKISTNIKLKCTLRAPFMSPGSTVDFFYFVMIADEGTFHDTFFNDANFVKLLNVTLTDTNPVNIDLDLSAIQNLVIPAGKTLYGAYTVSDTIRVDVSNVLISSENIIGYENSIDTVIEASRWVDLLKRGIRQYSTIPVQATKFESGGPFFKNAVFNRAMVSQKTDMLNVTLKDTLESVGEVNCDTEMSENKIFIDHYAEYYKNVEIGVLVMAPAESGTWGYNPRYMIKLFKYAYNKFEQFRTTQGTSQAIHTDAEFAILNDNADGTKEVKNKFIRDPLAIQAIVDLQIKEPTTSVSEDDDVYIIEIEDLPPGTHGGFGNFLNMRVSAGKLQILNRDKEGDSGDVIINWLLYGLSIGDSFRITQGENVGAYTIDSITASIITLTPVSVIPTFSGDAFIVVDYIYTAVNFVSRTDENFLSNATKFMNAGRSIKRNILEWFGQMLATMNMFCQLDMPNNYFKSNGPFTSQQVGEASAIVENSPILYSDLPTPLITPVIWDIKTICSFEDSKAIAAAYEVNRGYIRCVNIEDNTVIKVFPQKQKSRWANNEMTIIGEEKYENPFVSIDVVGGVILVDDIDHSLSGTLDWWRVSGIGMFQAFDSNELAVCSEILYDKVKVNGVYFNTPSDLIDAIQALI